MCGILLLHLNNLICGFWQLWLFRKECGIWLLHLNILICGFWQLWILRKECGNWLLISNNVSRFRRLWIFRKECGIWLLISNNVSGFQLLYYVHLKRCRKWRKVHTKKLFQWFIARKQYNEKVSMHLCHNNTLNFFTVYFTWLLLRSTELQWNV